MLYISSMFLKNSTDKFKSNFHLSKSSQQYNHFIIASITEVIGILPNPESYIRLVTIYLMEYSEDWSVSRSYLGEQSIAEIPQLAA